MQHLLSFLARFFTTCGHMIVTMMPTILGGIFNMVFCKTPLYKKYKKPMDRGKTLKDGRRVFGDNKTWVGFAGMVVCTALAQVLWGLLLAGVHGTDVSELYVRHANTVGFNAMAGALFGFAYMLFELPNSFVKRRLDIRPGKTEQGTLGKVFFVVDQVDSLFGVILVLACLTPVSVGKYFGYIALGGFIHITVNLVLYKTGIRKNL